MKYHRLVARLGLGALVVSTAVGCAQERQSINKVQANALAKSFFVGANLASPADDPEFYASTTVVDVPFGIQAGIFTGSTGELRRIKWEVTENALNARLTYEPIQDVDGKGNRTTNTGQVVASFEIQSHFDIKREYNPQTGEELNIIGENTSDRPWYERTHMRVDWSANKVESAYSFDPLAMLKLEGQELESISYRINDPNDPDAPLFSPDEGYFDITNKVYVKPGTINGVPSCYYYAAIVAGGSYPYGTCDPSEFKLRLSFLRIAQAGEPGFRDYEPKEWDGARHNAHGAFTHDRLGYDRQYGIVDAKWHHLLQRYNIWTKSHTDALCKSSVDGDGNGTDDDCASSGAGSQCDELVGKCTIPYAARVIRPNAWHYNLNGADEVVFEGSDRATEEWDTALRIAVQAARLVECQRTHSASIEGTRWAGTPCEKAFPIVQTDDAEVESVRAVNRCWKENGYRAEACKALVPNPNSVAALDKMIALCHSPVGANDDPMCGPVGRVTRPGDLRYHQVNVVPTPQSASPWGYGPTAADPLTGEVIQGSINVWNSVTDQAARATVDQIRWINGELSDDQITSGDYVRQWAGAASAHVPGSSPLLSRGAIEQRILGTGAMKPEQLAQRPALVAKGGLRAMSRAVMTRSAAALGIGITPSGVAGSGGSPSAEAQSRIALAKGTPTEAALVSAPWLQMAGIDKSASIDDDVLDRASPLRGLAGSELTRREQELNMALAQRGQCMMAAPEPNGIVALAKIIAKKFPYNSNASAGEQTDRVQQMEDYLRAKLHYAVIAHEMGHTIGMRHNFASSWDKFNYRPQYWQLRTRGGTVTEPCTGPTADGSTCVGPRYYDPLDKDELEQMIWMWSQTTVMDYAGDITQDMIGLGVFDYSAARAFYADVVDVRNDGITVPNLDKPIASRTLPEKIGAEMFDMVDSAIFPLADAFVNDETPTDVNPEGATLHYSQWNNFFRLLNKDSCVKVDTSAPAWWDAAKNGPYDPVFDGHIVRGERCDRIPVAYVDWRDMQPDRSQVPLSNYNPLFILARRALDNQGRPRMPYAFCTDEWVNGGISSCYQHDNGADIFEEMMFHDGLYEDRHIFDNFRRNRVNFSISGAYQRSVGRYHDKIATLAQEYSFYHDFIFHDIAYDNPSYSYGEIATLFEGEGAALHDFMLASSFAFDHFTRVLSRPQPGPHWIKNNDGTILHALDGAPAGDRRDLVDIPQGSSGIATDVSLGGRPLENGFVSSNGYYVINSAGSYYEKTYGLFSLVSQGESRGNWSRRQGVDGRFFSSNFTNLYPDGARRLIGSLLTEDQSLYAARVATRASTGLPMIENHGLLKYPASPIGWTTFTSPDGPSFCWPSNGAQVCTDHTGRPMPGNAATAPTSSAALDPELGFEIQKFIVFYSYVFLPASQRNDWLDMLRIFKVGADVDPEFSAQELVEWRDPSTGFRYFAKRFGDEPMMGRTYDKGMGAKMLQWANILSSQAYEPLNAAEPFDLKTGRYVYRTDAVGQPVVLRDPYLTPDDPAHVRCDENSSCVQLRNYRGLIDFSRDTARRVGFGSPCLNGIFRPGTECD